MNPQTLQDDIGFLKAVATEGGRPLARDGAVLVATGLVWGVCSLIGWLHITGTAPIPRQVAGGTLYATLPLIILIAALLRRNLPAAPAGAASRGMSGAWLALLFGFVALSIGLLAAAIRLRDPAIGWLVMTPMFAFYGVGWWVVWLLLRQPYYAAIGLGCFALTIVTGALAGTHDIWLAHGVGMLLLVAYPGWRILRGSRDAEG